MQPCSVEPDFTPVFRSRVEDANNDRSRTASAGTPTPPRPTPVPSATPELGDSSISSPASVPWPRSRGSSYLSQPPSSCLAFRPCRITGLGEDVEYLRPALLGKLAGAWERRMAARSSAGWAAGVARWRVTHVPVQDGGAATSPLIRQHHRPVAPKSERYIYQSELPLVRKQLRGVDGPRRTVFQTGRTAEIPTLSVPVRTLSDLRCPVMDAVFPDSFSIRGRTDFSAPQSGRPWDRLFTVEQIVAHGYFSVPYAVPETGLISDKLHTSRMGLEDLVSQIRGRTVLYQKNMEELASPSARPTTPCSGRKPIKAIRRMPGSVTPGTSGFRIFTRSSGRSVSTSGRMSHGSVWRSLN